MQPLLFFLFLLSFSSLVLFLLSFSFNLLVWFWSLPGPRILPFDVFSPKWRQISIRWFSKNRPNKKIKSFSMALAFKKGFVPTNSVSNQMVATNVNLFFSSFNCHFWFVMFCFLLYFWRSEMHLYLGVNVCLLNWILAKNHREGRKRNDVFSRGWWVIFTG